MSRGNALFTPTKADLVSDFKSRMPVKEAKLFLTNFLKQWDLQVPFMGNVMLTMYKTRTNGSTTCKIGKLAKLSTVKKTCTLQRRKK